MAFHIWLILLVFVIMAGVVLVNLLLRLQRAYQAPYFTSILYMTLAYLIEFLLIFLFYYIAVNLPQTWTPGHSSPFSNLFSLTPNFFGLLYFYYIVKTITIFKNKNISRLTLTVFYLLSALILLQYVRITYVSSDTPFDFWLGFACEIPFMTFNIWALVLLYPLLSQKKEFPYKSISRPFAIFFFIRQTVNQIINIFIQILSIKEVPYTRTLSVIYHTAYVALTFTILFYWLYRFAIPFQRDRVRAASFENALLAFGANHKLTERECDVVRQIVSGKSNKEIAVILDVSVSTVKNHIYNIFQKIDINTRFELIDRIQNTLFLPR